jgi:hypothetical protein
MSQNSRNQGFSYFISLNDRRIRIRDAQKRLDPVGPDLDPDPEHWFLGLLNPDLDLLVRGTDPAPDPDPSFIKQNCKKNLDFCSLFLKNDENVLSKNNKEKILSEKNLVFLGVLKVNDENSRIRIRIL